MADLPEDQKLTQPSTPNIPASDQPPIEEQPTKQPKQPDKPTFPPKQEEAPSLPKKDVKAKLSSLGVKPSEPKKPPKKGKIILAALSLLLILASIPAAVYLVQQRQEIRKEAAIGKQDHCTDASCEITVGPGNLSFVTSGHGTRNTSTPTISLNIPSGSTVYKAYAIWGGERGANTAKDNSINIAVNGGSPQGVVGNLATYSGYISDYNTNEDAFLADISSLLPTNTTSFSFAISGFLEGGYNADDGGGAGHGISIIIVYENSTNTYSKIKIKLWDEFVLRNTSATMSFSLDGLDTSETSSIKAGFFFGEGEGTLGQDRPNYLYYVENSNQRLNPTDGTLYPAYGSDPGYWWDTRITGDDLPAINALGGQASFYTVSPKPAEDPQGRLGDSIVWQGGILQYPVTPPSLETCNESCTENSECETNYCHEEQYCRNQTCPTETDCLCPTEILTCASLEGEPDPSGLSPNEEVTLTCIGSSDPNEAIDHFDFRVSIDGGTPVELGATPATGTDGEYQAQKSYAIPDYGCYKVECRACTSSDSSECTEWGQANGT